MGEVTENAPEVKEGEEETKVEAKPEHKPRKEWKDNNYEGKKRYDNNRERPERGERGEYRGGDRGAHRGGDRGDRRGGRGARGPKADDDGFVVHDPTRQRGGFKPRGERGDRRGGRGGEDRPAPIQREA